jgi:TolB protein
MMLADGSGVVRLTHDAGADGQPAWSPDGRRFVFHSTRDGGAGLWVQDLTGGDPMFLLADSSPELTPDWSPDGSRIAFTSMRSGNLHLWSVPAEGGEPMQLTTGEFRDVWPRWSPDGAQILFFSRRDTAGEHDQLYAMDWASRDVRRLTHQPTHHHFTPDWAPDGRRMVTAISDSATDRALVIFDLEGKPEARFGEGHAGVFQPVWSPDGGHIAYAARLEEGEAAELFLYRLPTR